VPDELYKFVVALEGTADGIMMPAEDCVPALVAIPPVNRCPDADVNTFDAFRYATFVSVPAVLMLTPPNCNADVALSDPVTTIDAPDSAIIESPTVVADVNLQIAPDVPLTLDPAASATPLKNRLPPLL